MIINNILIYYKYIQMVKLEDLELEFAENANYDGLSKQLDKMNKDDIIEKFIQLTITLKEKINSEEKAVEQSVRDRQIAKQMEWSVKYLNQMMQDVSKTYEGLYDVVKTSMHAGAVATEALAKIAERQSEPVITENKICTYSCDEFWTVENCKDFCDEQKRSTAGCCKESVGPCTQSNVCPKTGKRLPVGLSNNPDDYDDDVENAKMDQKMNEPVDGK